MAINLWIPRIEFNDVVFLGDLAIGTNVVSNLSVAISSFSVGMYITGTGIPTGTTITGKTSNTLTLSANATANETQISIDAFKRFDFTFPPSKDSNVDYKPNSTVLDSLSGVRQTQTNFVEALRTVEHWFINETDATTLENDFYLGWACFGNQFRYFPDLSDSSFLSCSLDKPSSFGKPRQIKKHPGFLYNIKMVLRYVQEISD